ncbi:polysaccharide deacetylase family protein [Flavobacteriaceae bacterium]|nr:polysaccharide deacetylase family protein [Flavobacteriaceae bacterium]
MAKKTYLTFLYHEATDNVANTGFQRNSNLPYKHKLKEFYDNIDIIFENCSNIITINDLKSSSNGTLLTFDDGGKSAMIIADYLEKYNLKGHFFITTSMIGKKCFLNQKDIIELHDRGHIIGSHSHSHPNIFKSLTYNQMICEWLESKKILENILNTKVQSCSVPGGDANTDTYLSAQECGFNIVFNSEPTIKLIEKENLKVFGRFCPKSGTNYSIIKNLCHHKGLKTQLFIRKMKNLIRTLFFPIYSKVYN